MPARDEYPQTVAEVLDPQMKFNRAALMAVRAFARSRPYRQSGERREQLVGELNQQLGRLRHRRAAVGVPLVEWVVGVELLLAGSAPDRVCGRFSVVTLLHEFGHARGFGEQGACRWSINLFAKCFPRSFARCRQHGHTLIRES